MNIEQTDTLSAYIEKWGTADSIALFDPRILLFSTPGINGVIGYRSEAGCAIVMADPVCPAENTSALTQAFHDYCKFRFKTVMYIMVSEAFTHWALESGCSRAISVGQEVIINPQIDLKMQQGSSIRRLRNKYNHALRVGVSIKEYQGYDEPLEQTMIDLCETWKKTRQGVQIYHSEINIFSQRLNKRWFYIEYQQQMIGFLFLNRVAQGWVLNRLLLLPNAPYGTSELVVLSVLDTLRSENCSFFSVGMTSTPYLTETYGFGNTGRLFIKLGFNIARRFLPLDGRQHYWEKFQPYKATTFLVINKQYIGPREAYGLMRAFNVSKSRHTSL